MKRRCCPCPLFSLFPRSSAQGFDGTGCCRVPSGGVCAVMFLCLLPYFLCRLSFCSRLQVYTRTLRCAHGPLVATVLPLSFFFSQTEDCAFKCSAPCRVVQRHRFLQLGARRPVPVCVCVATPRKQQQQTNKQTRSNFAAPDMGLKCAELFVRWGSQHSRVRGFCDGVCRK